jgi:alpha-tubulin suppressor-like RCC1 family protein
MKRYGLVLFTAALIGAMVAMTLPAGATQTAAEYWGEGAGITVANPTADDFNGTVAQVATSNSTWYAIKAGGAVEAWGGGTNGQLGNGEMDNSATPVKVKFPMGTDIVYMADTSPQATALAVDSTGQVWGWGSNKYGELCSTATDISTPMKLPFTVNVNDVNVSEGIMNIAGAGDHTLVVTSSGALEACGGNGDGDLGNDSTTSSCTGTPIVCTPVTVPLTGVTSVYASWRNSAALTASGQLYSWGYDVLGEVGDGGADENASCGCVMSPVSITPDASAPVDDVALGGSGPLNGQVLAIAGGQMYAWGSDAYSQLGNNVPTINTCEVTGSNYPGSYPCVTSPEASTLTTSGETAITPVTVKTGGMTSYAIDGSGNLYAWGDNSGDQIGGAYDTTCVSGANGAPGVGGESDESVCQTPVDIASNIGKVSTTFATVEDLAPPST